MLSNITWHGYWTTIALTTATYYLWVYLKYYRADFLRLAYRQLDLQGTTFTTENALFSTDDKASPNADKSELSESANQQGDEYTAYALMDEINAYLHEAKRAKCVREELAFALQTIFKKYSALKASSYRQTVSNFLVAECEHVCSVHFNDDDVRRMWNGG